MKGGVIKHLPALLRPQFLLKNLETVWFRPKLKIRKTTEKRVDLSCLRTHRNKWRPLF